MPEGDRAGVAVVVVMRSQLARRGLETMLQRIDDVRSIEFHRDWTSVETDDATGIATREVNGNTVVLVDAEELDDHAECALVKVAERGAHVVALLDQLDVQTLSRLARVPTHGLLQTADLDTATLATVLAQVLTPQPRPNFVRLTRGVTALEPSSPAQITVRITAREREVLVLLVEGLSNKQIGRRLRISEYGAKRHVANILAKLDCPNRTMAVSKALRFGLCPEGAESADSAS